MRTGKYLAIAALLALTTGCDEVWDFFTGGGSSSPGANGAITDVQLINDYPGGCSTNVCSHTYEISFKDVSQDSAWYYGIIDDYLDTVAGRAIQWRAENGNSLCTLSVALNHFDELNSGTDYNLGVAKCSSYSHWAVPNKVVSRNYVPNPITAPYFWTTCQSSCCTPSRYLNERLHVRAWNDAENDITGIVSWMSVDFGVKLCGEDNADSCVDMSAALLCVADASIAGDRYWAQIGLGRVRDSATLFVPRDGVTTEVATGSKVKTVIHSIGVAAHDSVQLKTELNTAIGEWVFSWNCAAMGTGGYAVIHSDTSAAWIGRTGNELQVFGELVHYETDLMGTRLQPQWFRNFRLFSHGSERPFALLGGDCDQSFWNVAASLYEFKMWDLHRQ